MTGTIDYPGSDGLLAGPRAVILNSRQSKFPIGDDGWITATGKAVRYLRDSRSVMLSSLEMNTWEIGLTFASRLELPVIVVAPSVIGDKSRFIEDVRTRFRLKADLTGFVFLADGDGRSGKRWWPKRDRQIIDLADYLLPISIRPGGTLETLIRKDPQKVNTDFAIDYSPSDRARPRYENRPVNPEISAGQWLIHFTRSVGSPWPDESDYEYYRRIIDSRGEYCHSAQNALRHILDSGTIYGSRTNIRGDFPVVAFTEITEGEISGLFRYRRRLVNPNFEPYGLALSKDLAKSLGLRPVIYGTSATYRGLDEKDRPYFQHEGSRGGNWRAENEWRHHGDFVFDRLPRTKMRVVVPGDEQARDFRRLTATTVTSMFTG